MDFKEKREHVILSKNKKKVNLQLKNNIKQPYMEKVRKIEYMYLLFGGHQDNNNKYVGFFLDYVYC